MRFIDYYLQNKYEFPELEFLEVTYSGNNVNYNPSYNRMKYLERDMVIMLPKKCSQLLKEKLESVISFYTYAYFNGSFYSEMNEFEKEKHESLFLTLDNKILIPIKRFSSNIYGTNDLYKCNEIRTLLNKINSFLDISGLDSKYFSIQSSKPVYSSVWGIQSLNFTDIKEKHLKLIDYTLFESVKVNFKKINFKKIKERKWDLWITI